ncbi:MerR family transcriptional regulator [Aquisalimonas sp.]|uniref:MerR family transcriptional regulator n=1 Tax=Aquisalimonas sp. TaxID=1872621 RepID=UPI0025BBED2B|nr:MerR family transcriptional regulator [Aquisalimonas sp.]
MSKGLYPIRTISSMTGVNPVTLRAWERRYGLIRPERTPKGHRLYTERDIDRIKQILVLLDRGIPISQARQVLDAHEPTTPEPHTGAGTTEADEDVWSGFLTHMRTAASVYDDQTLDEVLDEALSLFPAIQVQRRLLAPLHRRLAAAESADDRAVHAFLLGWLRTVLSTRLHHRSRRATGPRLLIASQDTPGDDIPLLLLALEAIERGYRTLLLAGSVSGEALSAAARDSGPEGLLLWSEQHAPPGGVSAPAVPEGLPVFLAGAAAQWRLNATNTTALEGDTAQMLDGVDARYRGCHTV